MICVTRLDSLVSLTVESLTLTVVWHNNLHSQKRYLILCGMLSFMVKYIFNHEGYNKLVNYRRKHKFASTQCPNSIYKEVFPRSPLIHINILVMPVLFVRYHSSSDIIQPVIVGDSGDTPISKARMGSQYLSYINSDEIVQRNCFFLQITIFT